jgi:hypothetical protein
MKTDSLFSSRHLRRLGRLALCTLIGAALSGCGGTRDPAARTDFPLAYPALHPRYRQWPVPAAGITVTQDPPVLQWPRTKGKGITYDIRLAADSSFGKGAITAADIPWALYNPHQALKEGTWYWQYRVHGKAWSPMLSFRVPAGARRMVSPTADSFLASVPAAHPRVLIDKKDEASFAAAEGGSLEARLILHAADSMLGAPLSSDGTIRLKKKSDTGYRNFKRLDSKSKYVGFDAMDAVNLFSRAYILSGDRKYADRGIAWALRVASWDPDGPSGFSDFGDGACMVAMAVAFDTFYDLLSPAQKKLLEDRVAIRAGRFYHKWVNDLDSRVLSNHVWQFILHYFFRTALAMHGDVKEADEWLRYAYELFLDRTPIVGGPDGGWAGGMSYFTINTETLLDIPTVIKQYTGFDFIRSNPFYRNNAYWMYYSYPPGSAADGFGDNVKKLKSPGALFLPYADALSRLSGSRVAATYATKIEEKTHLDLARIPLFRWFRMRYLQGVKRPDTLVDGTLAPARLFYGVGVVDMHSSLQRVDSDVMVSMRSSPFGSYGHMLADQNTFNILYGGKPLFYLSGYKVTMKDPHRLAWFKATVGHNGVLIDGKGQTFDPKGYGWIPRFLNGKNMTYAVGDASAAYGGTSPGNTGLVKFRRHLLFLHPDILVVYDELQADHAAGWSWLLHSPSRIFLDSAAGRFHCYAAKGLASGAFFASVPVRWAVWDTLAVPAENWKGRTDAKGRLVRYKNNEWHLRADTRQHSGRMRFLAVIRVGAAKGQPAVLSCHQDKDGAITVGGWTITAALDTAKPALLEACSADGREAFRSGGGALKVKGRSFRGQAGAAKMAEYAGDWSFIQTQDSIPAMVKEIPLKPKNRQP